MIGALNFLSLIISMLLFSILYLISLKPKQFSIKHGEKGWQIAGKIRKICGIFEGIATINLILWIWFPVESINQDLFKNPILPHLIGWPLMILSNVIMFAGVKAAGQESISPSSETTMYGGIYKYIRHPQALGEFPIFVIIGILLNSFYLTIGMAIFFSVYVPIMVYVEEKDLVLRFGDSYREYQKTTGALFPKLFRKNQS